MFGHHQAYATQRRVPERIHPHEHCIFHARIDATRTQVHRGELGLVRRVIRPDFHLPIHGVRLSATAYPGHSAWYAGIVNGERQIEMTWRCSSCQGQNLGRHVVCQTCGSPKDESEAYEMPSDTGSAATLTDPRLLAMARAGANWRCRYCGSDQRTLDGRCGQCGSDQREGRSTDAAAPALEPRATPARRRGGLLVVVLGLALALLVVLVLCGVGLGAATGRTPARLSPAAVALRPPFHDEQATVLALRWKQEVRVERWQVLPGEGFEEAKPGEAFDVRPAGRRFHHKERVVAGYDTQSYTETEPDGFRTETYSEQEACGQDCTPRPQTCKEKCTPNKNGFATCRTECSGGGQDCRTKYCSVTKTRQVPKTKTVQKTRQVPRYADVDRDAAWFSWKIWGWKHDRTLERSGTTSATSWPDDSEVKLGQKLASGEKERSSRVGTYSLDLSSQGTRRTLDLPGPEALTLHPPESQVRIRVWDRGRIELVGR